MPNQKQFDLTIDNFYSLQPDTAFAKSRATVNLYIDNEKVYFKEFDGALVKGKKDPKIFFQKDNQELENYKIIPSVTTDYELTVSSENFDSQGIQTRIEANSLSFKFNDPNLTSSANFIPILTNPNQQQTARATHNLILSDS